MHFNNSILAIKLLHIIFKLQYILRNIIYRLYKNKVKETVGWNPEVLRWCLNAAKESGMKEADYMGGLVIDEMKIQVPFQTRKNYFLEITLVQCKVCLSWLCYNNS